MPVFLHAHNPRNAMLVNGSHRELVYGDEFRESVRATAVDEP